MSVEIIYTRKSPVHYIEVAWELEGINLKEKAITVFLNNKRPWLEPNPQIPKELGLFCCCFYKY